MSILHLEGQFDSAMGRFAIVAARFNGFVVDQMLEGATQALLRNGVREDAITVVRVPGSFELPITVDVLARSGRFAGVIALGAVIRGATAHFDFVAAEASRGLADAAIRHSCPVGFGLLTTDNVEQALERAAMDQGNKGHDAAMTVLEMADLLARQIPQTLDQ